MLYAIEIWHMHQKCNVKDGRIDDFIPDLSVIRTDKFLDKEYVFHVIESNKELLMSRRAWNKSFLIIIDDIPLSNSIIFVLMYLRKASEDHLPANINKNMETLSEHITIAALDMNEWVPMYFALNPGLSSLIAITSNLNYFR